MELLIALAGLIALGLLAVRFGEDSSIREASEEEQLSRRGFTWAA